MTRSRRWAWPQKPPRRLPRVRGMRPRLNALHLLAAVSRRRSTQDTMSSLWMAMRRSATPKTIRSWRLLVVVSRPDCTEQGSDFCGKDNLAHFDQYAQAMNLHIEWPVDGASLECSGARQRAA